MELDQPNTHEIRSVFRLVDACREQWDHTSGWQETMLSWMQERIGLRVATLQFVAPGGEKELPVILPVAFKGWDSPENEAVYRRSLSDDNRPTLPNIDQVLKDVSAESTVVCSRPMVVPDPVWYSCEFYEQYVEPVGMDEFGGAFRAAPQLGGIVMMGGNMGRGDDPIPRRSLQLLGILAEEIVPRLGTELSLHGQVGRDGLTPRQQQTLDLLLEGLSEKQVAAELKLSPATVHEYVVKLHRHFEVSSRAELLSYFIKRKPKGRPRLG